MRVIFFCLSVGLGVLSATLVYANSSYVRFCYSGDQPIYMAELNPGGLLQSRESWGWTRVGGKGLFSRCTDRVLFVREKRAFAFATFNSANELIPIRITWGGLRNGGPEHLCVPVLEMPKQSWRYVGPCGLDSITLPVSLYVIGGSNGGWDTFDISQNVTAGATVSEAWQDIYQTRFRTSIEKDNETMNENQEARLPTPNAPPVDLSILEGLHLWTTNRGCASIDEVVSSASGRNRDEMTDETYSSFAEAALSTFEECDGTRFMTRSSRRDQNLLPREFAGHGKCAESQIREFVYAKDKSELPDLAEAIRLLLAQCQ